MQHPTRILLIRPSALGDVCRSVPVLTTLRSAFPHARIDWLVQDSFAPVIEHHPALSGVVLFPRKALSRWATPGGILAFMEWARCLAEPGYELVIDAQGLARSGLMAWLTGAPVRLGYANAQEAAGVFYSRRVNVSRERHTVDRMVELVCRGLGVPPVLDMRLHPGESDRAWAAGLDHLRDGFTLLAPTSRWPAKRWPAERFAELARALLDTPGGRVPAVAIVGAPGERDQCGTLLDLAARDPRVVDLIGQTSPGSLLALVERARLVVACDSAVLHMAVAMDRPCVALYGPTDVSRVGPFRRERDVIQHLCPGDVLDHKSSDGSAMMDRISVAEVLAACADRLDTPSRAVEAPRDSASDGGRTAAC